MLIATKKHHHLNLPKYMFQLSDVWCSGWTGRAAEEARPALNFWTPSRLFYQCKLSLKLLRFRHSQDSSSAMYVPDADISCKMSPFKHSTYTNQQMFLCLWCPSKIIQCCRQISWYISDDYPKTTMKIQLNSQMPKESKHLKAHSVPLYQGSEAGESLVYIKRMLYISDWDTH